MQRVYLQNSLGGAKSRFPSGRGTIDNARNVKPTQQTLKNRVDEKAENNLGVTLNCHPLAVWSASLSGQNTNPGDAGYWNDPFL